MNNFNFNRDFYEGCRALGDREGMALAWAMLRYGYEGCVPKLKPTTMAAFTFARGAHRRHGQRQPWGEGEGRQGG